MGSCVDVVVCVRGCAASGAPTTAFQVGWGLGVKRSEERRWELRVLRCCGLRAWSCGGYCYGAWHAAELLAVRLGAGCLGSKGGHEARWCAAHGPGGVGPGGAARYLPLTAHCHSSHHAATPLKGHDLSSVSSGTAVLLCLAATRRTPYMAGKVPAPAGSAAFPVEYSILPALVRSLPPRTQVVSGPPLEEHLAQNTLWPETHKLYGHGNDVYCCAASPDGQLLASACKAQVRQRAAGRTAVCAFTFLV